MSNSTAPNRVPLMSTADQNLLNRSRSPPLFGSPEEMNQLVAPPTKKRKLSETENAVCNEKELKNSFCKLGDDQKKVLKVAGGRLQDVNVAFYSASDVALSEKKDVKIEEVWSDHKQGTRGTQQTCRSYIEKVKEGLIPSSKFHYVRRRTSFSCKIEQKNTDASLYLPKEHDLEPRVDVVANRRTNMAIQISMEAAQIGTIPLVSKILERTTTKSEPFPISQVERKHSDNGTHDIDFKGSIGTMRDLEVRKKITKTYVRKKYRKPPFKAGMLDLDALHLLADTALNIGSEMQR